MYALQVNRSGTDMQCFYGELQYAFVKAPVTEILIPVDDWNSYVAVSFSDAHGG